MSSVQYTRNRDKTCQNKKAFPALAKKQDGDNDS